MNIGEYIKQLLTEGKRVVLPGFGNLEVKEQKSGAAPAGKRIDPPGLSVKFDSGYSKDDGLLAAAYASGESLDPEEAGQRVLELVDAIKFALDKGETYLLHDTGTFSRDDDGKTRFQSDPKWVLEPDQYGLESMELLELDESPEEAVPAQDEGEGSGEEEKTEAVSGEITQEGETGKEKPEEEVPGKKKTEEGKAEKERPEDDDAEKEKSGEAEKPGEEAPEKIASAPHTPPSSAPPGKPSERDDRRPAPAVTKLYEPAKQEGRKNRWKVIWIIAGALIVVLVVLILIPVDWNRAERPDLEERMEQLKSRDREGSLQEDEGESQESGQEGVESETVREPEPAEPEPPVEPEHNFFIIAGSFKHLQNASDFQDRMRAQGYPAEIMITENRLYRVSVSSHATKEEASRALAGMKSVSGLEACWLLSN